MSGNMGRSQVKRQRARGRLQPSHITDPARWEKCAGWTARHGAPRQLHRRCKASQVAERAGGKEKKAWGGAPGSIRAEQACSRGEVDALYDTCINAALARREWGSGVEAAHKPVISTANVWPICDLAVLDLWSAADPCVADGLAGARPFCA